MARRWRWTRRRKIIRRALTVGMPYNEDGQPRNTERLSVEELKAWARSFVKSAVEEGTMRQSEAAATLVDWHTDIDKVAKRVLPAQHSDECEDPECGGPPCLTGLGAGLPGKF